MERNKNRFERLLNLANLNRSNLLQEYGAS